MEKEKVLLFEGYLPTACRYYPLTDVSVIAH